MRYCTIILLLLFLACENDIKKIKLVTKKTELPDLKMESAEIIYTDTAKLKTKIISPELKRYTTQKEPYTEFPKGAIVKFYNSADTPSSIIKANYAIYYETTEMWNGKGDVYAVNEKGEELNTEEIWWNMKTGKIYSDKFSKITTADGVFYGKKGFEAEQDFTRWKLKGSEGTVNVKETN